MITVKTYVIGDIHGRFSALKHLLTKTPFDIDKDRLITLGDICDGGRKTKECYNLLLTVPNRVDVIGNHDRWFLEWINGGTEKPLWTTQGGFNTLESYGFDRKNVPYAHKEFIEKSLPYFVDKKKNLYVHGGFNPKVPIKNQKLEFLIWDRTILKYARTHTIKGYKHVFVGHTTTQMIDKTVTTPITMHNLTMCDCGGGYVGRLALVDVDTLDYWVSGMQVPRYEPDDEEFEDESWGYV
jgi:serine/threonine protein phosphatase 1